MSYKLHWTAKGVVKQFLGHVTSDELMQSVIETEYDARFDDLRYVINDFSDVTGISVESDVVEEISAIDKAAAMTNPQIRIAVVATRPEIIAIAEQYAESPINAYLTRIFPSMHEACAWLGVEHS